jgi:hypothetical protein
MAVFREGGVLLNLQEPLGWGCGRISGDGSRIIFWHDKWCWEMALKVAFLVLYGIAYKKDASIVVI